MLKRLLMTALVLGLVSVHWVRAARGQDAGESATARELTARLRQFLDDAGHNNAPGFDKFFADDVIYTRSAGSVTTKAAIMRSVQNSGPNVSPDTVFSAEDITIHEYGDTAVVAFRLVATAAHPKGTAAPSNYRNTGVFLKRNGQWQVVAWQSTKMPEARAEK